MGLIDFFKRWWRRRERARITVRSDDHLIMFEASEAEIDVTEYGGGYTVEELLIEADRVEVIDRDEI